MIVLGAGKASLRDRRGARGVLGDRLDGGAVVVRHGEDAAALERIEVLEADHPLPDARSVGRAPPAARAGRAGSARGDLVHRLLHRRQLGAGQPAARRRRRSSDKRELHGLLLGSGHADRRGQRGPQARLGDQGRAAGARGRAGADRQPDRLRRRRRPPRRDHRPDASRHDSTVADAIAVLARPRPLGRGARERSAPTSPTPRAESPDLDGVEIHTELLVTGETACEAMAREADAARRRGRSCSRPASRARRASRPDPRRPRRRERRARAARSRRPRVLVGCGGESTVAARPRRRASATAAPTRRPRSPPRLRLDGLAGRRRLPRHRRLRRRHRRGRRDRRRRHRRARAARAGVDLRAALARAPLAATPLRGARRRDRHRPDRTPTSTTCSSIAIGEAEAMSRAHRPMIELERVTKSFGDDDRRRRRLDRDRAGRVLLDARPERLRQDDDACG